MTETIQINRFLPYQFKGDPILVAIRASPGLVAGAEFKLYKKDSTNYLRTWKIGSQDGEESKLIIERDTMLLNKHVFTWQVLYCSKDVATIDGYIYIDFYQGGNQIRPNIPTYKEVDNLPPCAIKRYSKFTGSLIFVARV